MDVPFRIRSARSADAGRCLAIEQVSFSDPWSEAGFVEALETPVGFGLVAERDGEILGYVVGRVVAGEGEILNLAVAPGVRRTGVGRALLEAALDHLVRHGGREVFLEVRVSNLAARRLYEAAGFRVVGVRPRYYRRPVEDALVLRRALAPPA
jgi:ribosomal-protein-alanine N-acetyltransferase